MGKDKFICDPCEYSTTSKCNFDTHLKSAKDQEKIGIDHILYEYKCEPCDYYTNQKTSYTIHLKGKLHMIKCNITDLQYQFICNQCDYKTNINNQYKLHLQSDIHLSKDIVRNLDIETEDIIYPCDKCIFKTPSKQHFEDHLRIRHSVSNLIETPKLEENIKTKNDLGYNKEVFILNILKANDELTNLELIGYSGNKFDIIFKCKGDKFLRGIQIKTICVQPDTSNGWIVNNKKKYEDDTIIVGVNNYFNVFCIYKSIDYKKMGMVSFSVGKKYIQREDLHIFTNLKNFTVKLYEMIKISTVIQNDDLTLYNSDNHNKEFKMMENLKSICTKKELLFKINDGPVSSVDCHINGHRIQCKSSSIKTGNFYAFTIRKSGRSKNSKAKSIPYESTDFDYLICQFIPFPKFFFIIPISVLIEKGYVTNNDNKGKGAISLPEIDRIKHHWALNYLNNFDSLRNVKNLELNE
ncbi:MAG: hypothetical protein Hyperionvirus9_54 [Hyperionvirus sp.]|uniref:C2H2-type domain-containing protein n=1 Tax=Hyperionvirus sp. TaxID=2487770 RepID=A0A3G5A8P9_9VIRU|nr:MAG: hypothetical protein Hyperionvirus9_54 [Hyperionvirus sp.]